MTTTIPAMQAAAQLAQRFHEAYERLAPQFGYTTRPETRTLDLQSANGRLMVAVCQELLAAALDAGEPQPVAHMVAVEDGLGTVILEFIGERPPAGTDLYASPVAAAPQGDAKPERVGAEGWKRLAESQQAFIESDRRVKEISDRYGLSDGPGLRWQEDMRERLDEATKHLQANRWAEGFQSVQDALGLLDALGERAASPTLNEEGKLTDGERGAVSPSCAATDQQEKS